MLLVSKESGFEIQFRISLNQKLDLPVFEDWYSSLIRIARLKGLFGAQSDIFTTNAHLVLEKQAAILNFCHFKKLIKI